MQRKDTIRDADATKEHRTRQGSTTTRARITYNIVAILLVERFISIVASLVNETVEKEMRLNCKRQVIC
jgi:hypothetical protein